jgi:hypothetical protein
MAHANGNATTLASVPGALDIRPTPKNVEIIDAVLMAASP